MRVLLRFLHWGPLTALCIITTLTMTTFYFTSMWFPASESWAGFINHMVYVILVGLTLYSLFCAIILGPGYLPLNWTPENIEDCKYLQYCQPCKGYKAPRSHHCRKCDRCVLKMDHHCPWVNNCVGLHNHYYFTSFLLWSVVGCVQSSTLLIIAVYRSFYANWYFYNDDRNKVVYLTLTSFLFCIFSLSLGIGVIFAVGGLLFLQLKIILRNKTSIEDWIVNKAETRDRDDVFVYPYDVGRWANFKQVFFEEPGNGITWPVVEGCNQYTLTVEQLQQKHEKRTRSRSYQAIHPYNGNWFPLISQGLKTCIKFPFNDESRIPLDIGDVVTVTRWKSHWLYGEKLNKNNKIENKRVRGWFPKRCVVEVTMADPNFATKIANSHEAPHRHCKED